MQDPKTRATQHLIVQGFTLYTAAAAVCTRIVARELLDEGAWAVLFDVDAMRWTSQLAPLDPLTPVFADASVRAQVAPHVVCGTLGSTLTLPLEVSDVRDARMRIEAAIALGKAPPAERLESFSDEDIEREAKRRKKNSKPPAEPGQE